MATGQKISAQTVATSVGDADLLTIVQSGANKSLAKSLLIEKYDTGWVANSDWTDVELTVNHALTTNLSDLIVKFFISTDGTEANAFEVVTAHNASTTGVGVTFFHVDTANVKIQTGTNGLLYISDAGAVTVLAAQAYYYKVSVYKLG